MTGKLVGWLDFEVTWEDAGKLVEFVTDKGENLKGKLHIEAQGDDINDEWPLWFVDVEGRGRFASYDGIVEIGFSGS